MTARLHPVFAAALALATATTGAAPARAEGPDWGDFARVLARHVQPDEAAYRVNYAALRSDPLFERVVQQLAAFAPGALATRAERLAFYINAYNVLAIKVVLDHWPVASIRDAGNWLSPVWKKPTGLVGGKTVTLDEIEHQVLRPLGEPRVHFAIVCASKGCPDLRREPYVAARLEEQLDDQVHEFLRNPIKGLRVEDDRIRVSQIFDWFAPDFERAGGIEAFIRRYHPTLPAGRPLRADLPYDWLLNGG